MKWTRGLLNATVISVLLAILLSFVPVVTKNLSFFVQNQAPQEERVVHMLTPLDLREETLVSFLTRIPTYTEFKRVVLESERLFIDLRAPEPLRGEFVYQDAARLIATVFKQTVNVQELYISFRIYPEREQSGTTLAMAVVSHKDAAMTRALKQELDQTMPHYFIQQYNEVIYGSGWSN